jgi:hypothetical protein
MPSEFGIYHKLKDLESRQGSKTARERYSAQNTPRGDAHDGPIESPPSNPDVRPTGSRNVRPKPAHPATQAPPEEDSPQGPVDNS